MTDLRAISEHLINGQMEEVARLTKEAVDDGIDAGDILNKALISGMDEVGRRFKNNEFYVPEVLIAARAMKAGMAVLEPVLAKTGVEPRGRVVLGTANGDLHDIGKNLVGVMLKGAGFEIIDLGADVPAEKFVETAREKGAGVIGISALLTTTMIGMKQTIEMLQRDGMRDGVRVIVGGAPVTQQYADEIGADGYAPDSASAVDLVKKLLSLN